MFLNEIITIPVPCNPIGHHVLVEKKIIELTRDQLYHGYISILSDLEGVGVYEPVAEGIRTEWMCRRFDKRVLNRLDKRFKNIKRV